MSSKTEFLNEINKIKINFSLKNEEIILIPSKEYAEDWNYDKKCYEVEYKTLELNYYIIHELGHIFLANSTNYPYFARTSLEINEINIEIAKFINTGKKLRKELEDFINIFNYSNHLLDCFVNNNAFNKFGEYYPYYINYIDELLQIINQGFKFTELHDLLVGYVGFYIEFNYNLKFKNRKVRQQKVDRFLNGLKKTIVDNSTFPIQKFQDINRKLKNFSIIKSTKDPEKIVNFNYEVIQELSFWELETITEKFKSFFPRY
ncbi:MAG: hypothetical protein ACFFG0_51005 [Candidatus Thorarchaeota archaeon]